MAFANIKADIDRYYDATKCGYRYFVWRDLPSLLAVFTYRFGHWVSQKKSRLLRLCLYLFYFYSCVFVRLLTGIQIPKFCKIGPGLRIHHFGLLILNGGVTMGSNCTLRPGVVIGNLHSSDDIPVLGDNVEVGVGAKILGRIRIGNNCRIGANTFVNFDVPDGSTVVGEKGHIVQRSDDLEK